MLLSRTLVIAVALLLAVRSVSAEVDAPQIGPAAVPEDAVPQDAVPQDAVPKDAVPQDQAAGPDLAPQSTGDAVPTAASQPAPAQAQVPDATAQRPPPPPPDQSVLQPANGDVVPVPDGPPLLPPDEPAAAPDGEQPDGEQPDGEPVARGPLHEAFAEQVNMNPHPNEVVARKPPEPINEIPPEIKPEGTNIVWIPGYWAWDDEQEDYLWVSGVWRKAPPARRWLPGYWTEVEAGYRWVSGSWVADDGSALAAVPQPPDSLDVGPSSPAPANDDIWIPGCWNYSGNAYAWRAGYWSQGYDDWVWVPERYLWTPGGYAFCAGYWDYPVTYRGYLYAPYRFYRPIYTRPGYYYTPYAAINIGYAFAHLFVRPYYGHYYYGDYYGQRYADRGYYPWHKYHRNYGYSPLLSHYDSYHRRHGVDYLADRERWHDHYTKHAEQRPSRKIDDGRGAYHGDRGLGAGRAGQLPLADNSHWRGSASAAQNRGGGSRYERLDTYADGQRHSIGRSIDHHGSRVDPASRVVKLDEARRQSIARTSQQQNRDMIQRRVDAARTQTRPGSTPGARGSSAIVREGAPNRGFSDGQPGVRSRADFRSSESAGPAATRSAPATRSGPRVYSNSPSQRGGSPGRERSSVVEGVSPGRGAVTRPDSRVQSAVPRVQGSRPSVAPPTTSRSGSFNPNVPNRGYSGSAASRPSFSRSIPSRAVAPHSSGGSSRSYGGASRSYGGASRSYGGASRSYGGASRSSGGASRSYGGASRSYGGAGRSSGGAGRSGGGGGRGGKR